MYKNFSAIIMVLLFVILPVRSAALAQSTIGPEPFPVFPGIAENVQFWTKVYTFYTSRELVFHDSDKLMRIYGVKQIPSGINPWSRASQRLARDEKERYREMLLKFSHGLQPATDEEGRVYRYFGSDNSPQTFRDAANNIRTQLGQADRFREGIIRSGMYLEYIKEVFTSHGLPEDLAYLPHVESSFDYKAYSKLGAAGMWQFMRSTGRLYMKVNYLLDERRDPIRATVAAAQLLRYNFQQLDSWPLAVTAYNHGLAGMQRAVRNLGSADYMKVFNEHDGRRFGFASRNFYSEFLAAKEIAKNYKQYFGELAIQKPIRYEELVIDQTIDVQSLMAHFKVEKEQFEFLNLALRPPIYRAGRPLPKGYRVRLPINPDVDYQQLLASLSTRPRAAESATQVAQANQEFYQVQPGDTLWNISQQLQVSSDTLRDLNDLEGNRILVGQILKVPSNAAALTGGSTVASRTTEKSKPAMTKLAMIEPTEERDAKPSANPTAPAMGSSIGKQEQLAKDWDDLVVEKQPATTVPTSPSPVSKRDWHGTLAVRDIQGEPSVRSGRITLEPEETLGHLAEWLNVPTQKIRNLNGLSFNDQIRLGQRLRIPLTQVGAEEFEQKRLEYHQGLQEDFGNSYRVEGVAEYTVKRGDTIWKISTDELDLPLWILQEYNQGKDLMSLTVGDTLTYPVVVPVKS